MTGVQTCALPIWKAFAELVEDATRKVQQTLEPAVAVLRGIMEDGEENGQVRVSAARSVLEYGLKLTEQTDILTRLTELEAAMGGEHGQ